MVALNGFNLVVSRVPSISIHDEGDMTRNRPLTQCSYQYIAKATKDKLSGGRVQKPVPQAGEVEIRHGVRQGQ